MASHLKKIYSRRDCGRYVNIFQLANTFFQCVNMTLKGVDSGIWGGIVCGRHVSSVSGVNKIEIIVKYTPTEKVPSDESHLGLMSAHKLTWPLFCTVITHVKNLQLQYPTSE